MSLLSAHGIEKSHGPRRVLVDVAVTVAAGGRIGLVGDNGSGKTTLARILAGLEPPDRGQVMRQRGIDVGYLAQVPELDETHTALQAALAGLGRWRALTVEHDDLSRRLGSSGSLADEERRAWLERQAAVASEIERLGGWDQEHRARSILQKLGVAGDERVVSTLSGGERRRVALAALLVSEPEVLILDEPTNHLDTESIDWLERYLLEAFQGALVAITHDRYFLDRVVTQTWEVCDGEVRRYAGGWEAYLEAKAEREAVEARTEANRRNFLRTELEWLRRQPKARGTKQKARTARAEAAADVETTTSGTLQLEAAAQRQGSQVLELEALGIELGGRMLVRSLDLTLTPGQRVGVIGRNGCGKTSLLLTILGERKPTSGCVRLGKNTRIAYFSQERSELVEEQSVAENVAGGNQSVVLGDRELTLFSYLDRFSFRGAEIHAKLARLSGGERARVALAKLLLTRANLLILDEPTNDLDVSTLSALESMLVDYAGSALVVTHDRYFLDRVATSILSFEAPGEVSLTVGDYATHERLRRERGRKRADASSSVGASPEPRAARARPVEGPKKLSYREQKELDGMEAAIEAAEERAEELETALADPELYQSAPERVATLGEELEAARARARTLMDRWQELETKRERYEASR